MAVNTPTRDDVHAGPPAAPTKPKPPYQGIVRQATLPYPLQQKTGFDQIFHKYQPATDVGQLFKRLAGDARLDEGIRAEILEAASRILVVQSSLALRVFRGLDGIPWLHPGDIGYDYAHAQKMGAISGMASYHPLLNPARDRSLWNRLIEDYGIVSRRVVTNAGVNYMVTDFAGTGGDITNYKYHGIGTGTNVEANADTALQTELTTEYNPNSTRATGSQVDVTATPHQYQSVGTNTLDSGTPAITEHGLFSAASSTTLWDRSVFSAINLNGANGDGLQSTYTLTINAGG